ncbi:uncharacterized protein L969DRAFT_85420 [Mixia osmundae IAM 14324]|uniref:uncharacterized protein n=1 Tax=Mixia osmundae (strain CBS 9802 / IAM 14324 / JCM 22182 / KY 12970) TaxID=764103 RepID=UPI0004A55792|nr:uncharacterized protein L969DRAFT_85420 [Mixia osmundae IAM 14324]KEI41615.1 hypothetical protein L969DRAFT_85420 [Mixia osmundae IAM 14324]
MLTITCTQPRLVVVSKLKPPSDILALHEKTSHLHFGENYVQELVDKASILPASIRWRFIGSLQSNKCKVLAAIPNLAAVETLDSVKKADLFERALSGESDDRKLAVYLQVNTSGEESKSGLPILADRNADGELAHLALHVLDHCPHLELQGLMTIGAYDNSNAPPGSPENADFRSLRECRDALKEKLGDRLPSLELSMGMSSDFADAIRSGSDNIRVGSKLMGSRPSKAEAKEAREQQKVSA